MHQINLLPWRGMQRGLREKQFKWRIGITVVSCAIAIFAVTQFMQRQLSAQHSQQQQVQKKVEKLDIELSAILKSKKEYQKIVEQLELINTLQKQRNNAVRVFNLLPAITPKGIILEKVSMQQGIVTLEGLSNIQTDVGKLLSQIEQNLAVQNIRMHSIVHTKQKDNVEFNRFKATFKLREYVQAMLPEGGKNAK
ncbi:MAG: PilN domain-containing protein [Vibrionaceae bacterium]